MGGMELREADWPEYKELHLGAFSEEQSRLFLRKYLAYKIKMTSDLAEKNKIQKAVEEQVDRLFDKGFSDLARRPVQLKMLAEVLPSWKGGMRELTVSKLYSYFIDLILEREQDKLARQRFNLAARRAFARDLAVFLWLNKGEMSITSDSIPAELIITVSILVQEMTWKRSSAI